MSVIEAIGLFWVVLATGLFTAAVFIAAMWSMVLGLKVATRRYRLGEAMERTLDESEAPQRPLR